MKGPLDIHQYLLAHDVHHEIVRLPRVAPSTASLAEALGLAPHRCVAVRPFQTTTPAGELLAVVLAPSDSTADDAMLCAQLSAQLSDRLGGYMEFVPACAQFVSSRTDYLASHLSPLLLPPDVIVFALQSLADLTTSIVYAPTGDAGTAVGLAALDIVVLSRANIVAERRLVGVRRRPVTLEPDTGHAVMRPAAASPAEVPAVRTANNQAVVATAR